MNSTGSGLFAVIFILMALRKAVSMPVRSTFYESIGKPKFISAPMVSQSYLPWRLLVRQNGVDLAYSQMLHARNFKNVNNYRKDCVDWENYEHISGSRELAERARKLDSMHIAQLAGDDPDTLVDAGRLIQNSVLAIDLNLGCPQKIAKKGNYGAYLLPHKELIVKLLTAMVEGLACPVTCKVRVLSTEKETLELCRAIEGCGVSMLTVHGRQVRLLVLMVFHLSIYT